MPTATTYANATRDYYDAMLDRCEFTFHSAEHDADLVEDVVSTIRKTILTQMARLEREAHGNLNLSRAPDYLTVCMMEEIGEHLDGPMCTLWHDMCRTVEAAPEKVAA